MKKLFIAAALAMTTTAPALADSSALDVYTPEPVNRALFDFTPTASIGNNVRTETRARLGDGSPQYMNQSVSIDRAATAAIGAPVEMEFRGRLGDGSPQYH